MWNPQPVVHEGEYFYQVPSGFLGIAIQIKEDVGVQNKQTFFPKYGEFLFIWPVVS